MAGYCTQPFLLKPVKESPCRKLAFPTQFPVQLSSSLDMVQAKELLA
nr:MAG TPA: hypothetical protein [Caudoviricetes sp.]